jgi:galactoside O-acetyltransferase
MSCYTENELKEIGFKVVGSNVHISTKASFYGVKNISIGSNVRIDDFVVISSGKGGVIIGDYIHIAVFSSLIGGGNITLCDFVNISSRVSIYSSNDDYSGLFMTNPMVPEEFTNVEHKDVYIGKHSIIGSGCVVLPGVSLNDGCAIGALSLVDKDCLGSYIYAGVPVKAIKERKQNFKLLEKEMRR